MKLAFLPRSTRISKWGFRLYDTGETGYLPMVDNHTALPMVFPAVTVYGHVPLPLEQPTEKQPASTATQETTTYTFDWQIGPVTQPFMAQNAMTIIQSS
jgi:hypothetical protein